MPIDALFRLLLHLSTAFACFTFPPSTTTATTNTAHPLRITVGTSQVRMEPAEAVAYRSSLVESGAADEILRILVGLGEAHDRGEAASDAAAVQYILDHFEQGTRPSLVKLKLTLPAGTPRPPTVLVRLWDDDLTKRDEPLAAAEVPLEAGSGRVEKFPLPVAESRCVEEQAQPILISFDYEVALDAEARAAEDAQ